MGDGSGEHAAAGEWVQVHQVLLQPGDRAANLPGDTSQLPYEALIKGFLVNPGRVGEVATIRTPAGRSVTGTLVAINPGYQHTFGRPVTALTRIGPELRAFLEGDE